MLKVSVDLGLGDSPSTTIEFAAALKDACSASAVARPQTLKVVGVEVMPERLDKCQCLLQDDYHADLLRNLPTIDLRLGGTNFVLPLHDSEPRPILIRAMNVLRSYPIPDAIKGLRSLFRQLSPKGGTLIEGSAEAEGRVVVTMVINKSRLNYPLSDNGDCSSSDDESELGIDAVVFAADFDAIAKDPELSTVLSVSSWFNRNNHLPRLWRGFCDLEECSDDAVPSWASPVRKFLLSWAEICDGIEKKNRVDGRICPKIDAAESTCVDTCGSDRVSAASLRERFVLSAEELARRTKAERPSAGAGSAWVNTAQASRGILVWYPGLDFVSGGPALVVPDVDEYYWWEERIGRSTS